MNDSEELEPDPVFEELRNRGALKKQRPSYHSTMLLYSCSALQNIFLSSYVSRVIDPWIPLKKKIVLVEKLPKEDNELEYYTLNFLGLVRRHEGYLAFEYNVKTEDGQNLKIHRMQYSESNEKPKPVMLLQHGWGMSSDGFVLRGPGKDLAFFLAKAGYDVWFGNVRGNVYSQMQSDGNSSYDFSYHEHGVYDLRATIDFILKETNQVQLSYLGYSMGTTMGYVLLSQYPAYNEKIRVFHNFSPVVFWDTHDCKPLGQFIFYIYHPLTKLYDLFDFKKFLTPSAFMPRLAKYHRNKNSPLRDAMISFSSHVLALDKSKLETELLPEFWVHHFAGTSIKVLQHYFQNCITGQFQAFNYDNDLDNFKRYGSYQPPDYDLSKITAPVRMWYSTGDQLINYKDVEQLKEKLPNVLSAKLIEDEKFNHGDFLWSKKAKELIYDELMEYDGLDL